MVAIEGSVWVDTNQTNSFADETELKDINRQFSAATFQAEKGESWQAAGSSRELRGYDSRIEIATQVFRVGNVRRGCIDSGR